MDAKELQYILKELHFLADVPVPVLESLAETSTLVRFAAGETVFRERTVIPNLYLVRSGRMALEMNVPGRGPVRILTVGPGEMMGWSSVLDRGQTTASAISVEDSELVVAPATRLRELCEANADFGFSLMQQLATALAKRLVATRLQLLDLFADRVSADPGTRAE